MNKSMRVQLDTHSQIYRERDTDNWSQNRRDSWKGKSKLHDGDRVEGRENGDGQSTSGYELLLSLWLVSLKTSGDVLQKNVGRRRITQKAKLMCHTQEHMQSTWHDKIIDLTDWSHQKWMPWRNPSVHLILHFISRERRGRSRESTTEAIHTRVHSTVVPDMTRSLTSWLVRFVSQWGMINFCHFSVSSCSRRSRNNAWWQREASRASQTHKQKPSTNRNSRKREGGNNWTTLIMKEHWTDETETETGHHGHTNSNKAQPSINGKKIEKKEEELWPNERETQIASQTEKSERTQK